MDDSRDAADSLAEILRLHGHGVRVAYDAAAALLAEPPDVVILEPRLPGTDGWELVRRMRGRGGEKPPLYIAVTTLGRDEDRRRSAGARISLHLVKPVEPAVLVGALKRIGRVLARPGRDAERWMRPVDRGLNPAGGLPRYATGAAGGEGDRMPKLEQDKSWVISQAVRKGVVVGPNAVCDQDEWEEMERLRPGAQSVVQMWIASEGVAERLARGTSGDPVPRGIQDATTRFPKWRGAWNQVNARLSRKPSSSGGPTTVDECPARRRQHVSRHVPHLLGERWASQPRSGSPSAG